MQHGDRGRQEALTRYVDGGHQVIEGWLGTGAINVLLQLDDYQAASGVQGAVCEIGVHHGRLFVLLALLRRVGEKGVAIDVFEDQHLNVDWSGSGNRDIFRKHLDAWGARGEVVEIKGDSLRLRAPVLSAALDGQALRIVSVDGGHQVRNVLNDMHLVGQVLHERGVVVLDDYLNPDWPGVAEGIALYLARDPLLAPFWYGDNKLLLCPAAVHSDYLAWTERVIVPHSSHAKRVELGGYACYHTHPWDAQTLRAHAAG